MMYNSYVQLFISKERGKNKMKKTRIMAVLAAGAMLLSACGGNKELSKDAMKVGKYKVTAGDIAVLSDLVYTQYTEMYAQYGESAQVNFKDIREQQVKQIKETLEYASIAKAMKIKLDDIDKDTALKTRANYAKNMGGYEEFEKYVEANGSSIKALDEIFEASAYASKLTEKLNEEFGDKEPTDEELKKAYTDTYYCAKHILITKEQDGAKELADKLLERAKGGEDFDALMSEYSEDPGQATYPDGYVFTDGQMVEPFENKVKELKVGGMGICESDYGYHVILRLELPAFEKQKNDVASYYPQYRIEKRTAELVKKYKIKSEVKQDVINGITEGKIKKDNTAKSQEAVPQLTY